jgi:uncharacterized membrane-anchored protein YitT (DUF2179 family)
MPTAASPTGSVPAAHTLREDALALVDAALFVALGLVLLRAAGLFTGGTAGAALLVHYASGLPFGLCFFAINLPFYWLAWRRLGPLFTLKTLGLVAAISALAEAVPLWLAISHVQPVFAALMGGTLIGCGLLILFRHGASLGGLGIVALLLQRDGRISAGRFSMGADVAIVAASLAIADLPRVALSVLGALALNIVLTLNHRPGRYLGVS